MVMSKRMQDVWLNEVWIGSTTAIFTLFAP